MRWSTRRHVESFWCDLFGITEHRLWSQVSVAHPHGRLGDYEGWYVAWREHGEHVSAARLGFEPHATQLAIR